MEDTNSKILIKGGKRIDIFLTIDTNKDGPALVNKIKKLIKDDNSLIRSRNDKNQTILIYAFLKDKSSVVGYILNFINRNSVYRDLIDARDNYNNSYSDYESDEFNSPNSPNVRPVNRQLNFNNMGGGYAMYNNKKYKICTGKRGGKYICVGVDKKKIYV